MKELHINYVVKNGSKLFVINNNSQSQPFNSWPEASNASEADHNCWTTSETVEEYENNTPIEWV